jgi:hypothetical protein
MPTKKCAHPACTCQTPEDKMYCSAKCASHEAGQGAKCPCEHLACKGR